MDYDLNQIEKCFNITEETLKEREDISLYIESLSYLIVDKFYDYLLLNEKFATQIDTLAVPRLKRLKAQFIISIFSDPFDNKLLEKLSHFYRNYQFEINSYLIASEFEVMNQTIIDISSVNHQLRKHLKTVLKFLHITEFTIQKRLSTKKTLHLQNSDKNDLTILLGTFFKMLSIHKNKHEYLLKAWHSDNLLKQSDRLPTGDVKLCQFNDTLQKIKSQFGNLQEYGIDIDTIDKFHIKYHNGVEKLYELVQNDASFFTLQNQIEALEITSEELFSELSKPFENSASLTFLTVNSGMRFIHTYASIFNETKVLPFDDTQKMQRFITTLIEKSFNSPLAWAIDSYKISSSIEEKRFDIEEKIALNSSTTYIYIQLKHIPYKSFVEDTLRIFLEILKISLTDREKEHTLTSLADKAESANRSKDMFLANMSHELRTPLNAIIGFSQVLQVRPEIPQNMRSYIEKISIAGNNLLSLVNTILDFAKLEAGKISYHPKMVMLSELLNEISIIISPLAQEKNISISFPKHISLTLFIDPQLIKQVFINILSNAIKFTPDGGTVSLKINFNKEKNNYIISICDTGIGMSKEAIGSLFTPFTQIDNEMQSKSKGTGLGLVISKKIVEDLHSGEIWVESEENKGTCFFIAIPTPNEQSKVEIFASKNTTVEKLLIVEDTEEYVQILLNRLNDKYDITVTNSINKAKELLDTEHFDKIILDFFLIDGISSEILAFMDESKVSIPVFMVSAEDDYKIVEFIQESDNVVGVFNKTDIDIICSMLLGDKVE